MKKFFRWIRTLFSSATPKLELPKIFDKPARASFGMTRREFFTAAGATLAVAATTAIKLDRLMPLDDSWRYGWIREPGLQNVYYGIDMGYPLHLKIWLEGEEISFDRLKAMAGYHGVCAEINISQGHAGLKYYSRNPEA